MDTQPATTAITYPFPTALTAETAPPFPLLSNFPPHIYCVLPTSNETPHSNNTSFKPPTIPHLRAAHNTLVTGSHGFILDDLLLSRLQSISVKSSCNKTCSSTSSTTTTTTTTMERELEWMGMTVHESLLPRECQPKQCQVCTLRVPLYAPLLPLLLQVLPSPLHPPAATSGQCQFTSLATALTLHPPSSTHRLDLLLRQLSLFTIATFPSHYASYLLPPTQRTRHAATLGGASVDLSLYLKAMKNPRTDGDAVTLQSMADILGITVVIVRKVTSEGGGVGTTVLRPRGLPWEVVGNEVVGGINKVSLPAIERKATTRG